QVNSNGSFLYSPTKDYSGTDSFTYQATDGNFAGFAATVTITVTPVNDPPVAANDQINGLEDTTLPIIDPPGVLVNDADPDGDLLTSVLVAPTQHGTLSLGPAGNFSY